MILLLVAASSMRPLGCLHAHQLCSRPNAFMLAVSEASSVEASEAGFAAWWDDADEEVSNRVCNIVGELPSWLRGTLIRNGPGRWESGDGTRRYTHAFDGLAKLVSFDICAEGVTFSTRFLRSDWFEKSKNGAFPPSVTTGPVDPPWSATEGVAAALTGQAFDNTPVNLHRLGGGDRWVAVTDAPPLMEFDPSTLETLGRIDSSANAIVGLSRKFGVGVPGFEAFSTAHPQRHPTSGETLNYHLELRPVGGPVAHIVAASSATGSSTIERRIVGSLELEALGVPGIPYVHSFGVTEHHVCLMLYPLYVPFGKLVNGRGFLPQLDWDAGRGSRLVVWDLRHPPERKPQVWRAPACWAYHVINAFEEQGTLTLDLNAYREPSIVTGAHGFAYLPNMRGGPQALAKQERDAGCDNTTRPPSRGHARAAALRPTLPEMPSVLLCQVPPAAGDASGRRPHTDPLGLRSLARPHGRTRARLDLRARQDQREATRPSPPLFVRLHRLQSSAGGRQSLWTRRCRRQGGQRRAPSHRRRGSAGWQAGGSPCGGRGCSRRSSGPTQAETALGDGVVVAN